MALIEATHARSSETVQPQKRPSLKVVRDISDGTMKESVMRKLSIASLIPDILAVIFGIGAVIAIAGVVAVVITRSGFATLTVAVGLAVVAVALLFGERSIDVSR